jgi:hypothetical protein
MIFAGFQVNPDIDPPKSYSLVREDGAVWDFTRAAFVVPAPAVATVADEPIPAPDFFRPVTFLKGVHDGIGQLWADAPVVQPDGKVAIYYHRDANGGPLHGQPEPVYVEQRGDFAFSYAFAVSR